MKKLYIISTLLIVIGIAAGISYFILRDVNAKIPDNISLMTMNKKEYTFGKANKKLKLVEFMYTHCPDVCPTTTQKMNLLKKDLQKAGVYGKDIQFITITFDPYRDTPEVLRKYMKTFGIENDGNWIFLTANPKNFEKDRQEIKKLQILSNFNTVIQETDFTYILPSLIY